MLKFLLDENMSHYTYEFLKKLNFDVKEIPASMRRCDDEEVVKLAVNEGRIIITCDLDFGRIYYFSEKGEFGAIVIRLKPLTVENVNAALEKFLLSVDLEKERFNKCLMILDKKKIRVIRR